MSLQRLQANQKWDKVSENVLNSWVKQLEAVSSSVSAANAAITAISASVSVNAATITALSASVSALNTAVFSKATFLAHNNGTNITSISATQTPVTFSTEDWDVGGYFSSSAYIPPAGKYRLSCQLQFLATNAVDNEALQLFLLKNGSTHKRSDQNRPGTNAQSVMITALVDANGTDSYTISAAKGGAGVGIINGASTLTWFCGEAI